MAIYLSLGGYALLIVTLAIAFTWLDENSVARRVARWRYRRQIEAEKLDPNAKCFACGHRRGRLRASAEFRMMIHKCTICRAQWGEPFLVNPDKWMGPVGNEKAGPEDPAA